MSSSPIFSRVTFRKYTPGKIVASNGKVSLQELSKQELVIPEPPDAPLDPITTTDRTISLSSIVERLGLKPGMSYSIECTAKAPKYYLEESERSNPVKYAVK